MSERNSVQPLGATTCVATYCACGCGAVLVSATRPPTTFAMSWFLNRDHQSGNNDRSGAPIPPRNAPRSRGGTV